MAHPDITPDMRRWVENWKKAGPELAAIRREELRQADNAHVLELLSDAFEQAATLPLRSSSGLVEMQRLFAKLASVKHRVMGRMGHLSNEVACNFIREVLDSRTSTLILGHLSEHNNHPEIVRLMASQSLEERCLSPKLVVADPGKPTEVFVY